MEKSEKKPAASCKGKNAQLIFHSENDYVCITILDNKRKPIDTISLTRDSYLQLSTMIYKTCFPAVPQKLDLIKP